MTKFTPINIVGKTVHILKRCYITLRNVKRVTLLMVMDAHFNHLVRKSLKLNKSLGYSGEISGKKVIYDKYEDKNVDVLTHFEESTSCILTPDMSEASVALIWGTAYRPKKHIFLRSILKGGLPIIIVEDGFIRSIMPFTTRLAKTLPKEMTVGLSYIVDHKGVYFDAKKGSAIIDFLNSDWIISSEEEETITKAIAYIKEKSLSKYNVVKPKIINFNCNNEYSSVVLVVDQCFGDKSISGAKANNRSFRRMLKSAIVENPDSLILIKTHPVEIIDGHRGYFSFYSPPHSNIVMLYKNLNPISLLQAVDKVYVVSSQMGMEALLCGKKVVCYGTPFYSGWGLTIDQGVKSYERRKNRTLEELFYAAYFKFTYYYNPATRKKSDLHGVLRYLASQLENQP